VKIQYKFLRFSAIKILNFINTGAELGQYFCAYIIEKQNENSTAGLKPHNLPSGYIIGFFLVQTTWDMGTTKVNCT